MIEPRDEATMDERRVDAFVELLDRQLPEVSAEQLEVGWARVQQRKAEIGDKNRGPRKNVRRRAWLAGFATASVTAVVAVLALKTVPHREESLRYAVEGTAAGAGGSISSPTGSSSRLRFSDDSRIDLGSATRVTVESLDARGAQIQLLDGDLDVYVKPRANASWRFVAGPFRVNVKGTEFHLAFSAASGRLALQMRHGLVEVLAPPNRTIAVGGQESIELFAAPNSQATVASSASVTVPSGPRRSPAATMVGRLTAFRPVVGESGRRHLAAADPAPETAPTLAPAPAPTPWPELLTKGRFATVVEDAERRGIETTLDQASAADLSALADAARYIKRYPLARQVLLALRSRFSDGEKARDASFFLGRLAEATQERSQTALSWYETYLRESPDGLYASEALGREMALLASHAPDRARKVATQYLARFPHGPQVDLARSLLETNSD